VEAIMNAPPVLSRLRANTALLLAAAAFALAARAAAAQPADVKPEAAQFVQSFANTLWNREPICIRVEGLDGDKDAQVKARIAADARAVGLSVGRAECGLRNQVEVRFAADADRAVREILDYNGHPTWPFPMDRPAGADRPIRAWYGVVWDHAGDPGRRRSSFESDPWGHKKLNLAIVAVDPARTRDMSLDLVSDYAALLALSQPRALDRCNVLPSITDLFAGACPGRAAPRGLTAADVAYLEALYQGSTEIRARRFPAELVDGMAKRLAADRIAAR
jgi:hypothetical protein